MLLKLENVSKSFATSEGAYQVLDGVNLKLNIGETLALTGESGSGKSTLLHLIGGLDTPESGAIILNDQDVARMDDKGRAAVRRSTVGIVFQQFNLIPSLTVADNLSFQARLAGRMDHAFCAKLQDRLGLGDLGKRYPEQLSGGQQQRLAIGRALAARPRLVLADEPTGNLDEETGDGVLDLMLDLVGDGGAALLMVTHSTRLAARLDRRVHLSQGHLA